MNVAQPQTPVSRNGNAPEQGRSFGMEWKSFEGSIWEGWEYSVSGDGREDASRSF
jgi:hypothetical protein